MKPHPAKQPMLLPVPHLDNDAYAFNPSGVEIKSVDTEEGTMKVNFVQPYTAEHLVFVSFHYKSFDNEEYRESQSELLLEISCPVI